MERYLCIHGHFYQPPRENPWLEAVERQASAHPYHDWNERITAECYAPNAGAHILDAHGNIAHVVNNYAHMSFNFGPTLLSWLEKGSPKTYQALLEADRESARRCGGHGNAMAQGYNHMILPLANARDKRTQVLWGIRDFERRFGRAPEGMWLPETAVDLKTLEALAQQGINFTVLAPHQAQRVRSLGAADWQDVSGGRVDPCVPYVLRLPSGLCICLFFYHGPLARAVAFERLLENGEALIASLMGAFDAQQSKPQLVHLATDGETFGHHHRFGEMALSYALHHVEARRLARLTNYGEFLAKHPPAREVEIVENSSWSCTHGVERWRADCGCTVGGQPGWTQAWRTPLRGALDWLRDELARRFEEQGAALLKDPWAARDAYIDVVLDRSTSSVEGFLNRHRARPLSPEQQVTALKLLELQRQAMLMFTSCAWFFEELSRIETVQVLRHACRALQWAREALNVDFEPPFLERLAQAQSNLPDHGDGRQVYQKLVKSTGGG